MIPHIVVFMHFSKLQSINCEVKCFFSRPFHATWQISIGMSRKKPTKLTLNSFKDIRKDYLTFNRNFYKICQCKRISLKMPKLKVILKARPVSVKKLMNDLNHLICRLSMLPFYEAYQRHFDNIYLFFTVHTFISKIYTSISYQVVRAK